MYIFIYMLYVYTLIKTETGSLHAECSTSTKQQM